MKNSQSCELCCPEVKYDVEKGGSPQMDSYIYTMCYHNPNQHRSINLMFWFFCFLSGSSQMQTTKNWVEENTEAVK